jgi:hypothetical protein
MRSLLALIARARLILLTEELRYLSACRQESRHNQATGTQPVRIGVLSERATLPASCGFFVA